MPVGPGKMVLGICLDRELVRRVDRVAAASDMSRSKFIQRMLMDALDQEEAVVQVTTDPVLGPMLLKALASPEVSGSLLRVLRADLTDQQLALFQDSMSAAASAVQQNVGRVHVPKLSRKGRKS